MDSCLGQMNGETLNSCKPIDQGDIGVKLPSSSVGSNMSIYRLILVLLHWCIALRDCFIFYYGRLMQLRHAGKNPCSVTSIRKDAIHLKKLPLHLGLVLVEDELSMVDIAKIVVWAMAAGISHITIYDHKGCCKQNKDFIFRKLQEQEARLEENGHCQRRCSSLTYTSLLKSELNKTSSTCIEGFHKQNSSVQIIGPEDGRQHLVNITKQLSHQMTNRDITSTDINVPLIDAIIREKYSFPDPDLVMKFGAVDSLLGFMPWQSRLTEILNLPTHHHINFASFYSALVRFGKTEQRYGQ